MDDAQKQILKAEIVTIKSLISSAGSPAAALNQTMFPVTGSTVNIPVLASAAQAFRAQTDAMEKLANLVEKVINAS